MAVPSDVSSYSEESGGDGGDSGEAVGDGGLLFALLTLSAFFRGLLSGGLLSGGFFLSEGNSGEDSKSKAELLHRL